MSKFINIVVLLANISALLQVTSSQSTIDTSSNGQVDPLQLNAAAFDDLRNRFSNVGPMLYDVFTNPNALGRQMSQLSALIAQNIGSQNYINAMNTIFDLVGRADFQGILGPLIQRTQDIGDENTGVTLGEALQVISNIFSNENSVQLIRQRIRAPASVELNTATAQ